VRPIVVGVDGSGSARRALVWAAGAAQAVDAELLLVAAVTGAAQRADVEKLLETEWADPARQADHPFRTMVVDGDPRLALDAVAIEKDAALMVVGAGHERWFPALHLGSVSHHLAQHAGRPLCVVPGSASGFDVSRIVIGLDGSPGSASAAGWCGQFASASGGTVTAIYAWQHFVPPVTVNPGTSSRGEAERSCSDWAATLRQTGVLAEACAVEADPAAALARAVTDTGATVLVLGTRGSGGFKNLRIGSVALRLLQSGQVPIVLVPSGG